MASLISINSHGLRMDDRRQTAFLFFKRHKFDIVFIQETHWTDEQKSAIEQDWDGDIYFNPGTRNACGVAILINSHLDYQLHHRKQDSHGRVLALEISFEDTTINLVNIYAPRSDLERRSFFTQLETFLSDQFENILGGDFNCIADLRLDKLRGNPDARQSANTSLLNIMSRYSLFDIWRERNKSTRNYTWSGKNPKIIPSFAPALINSSLAATFLLKLLNLPFCPTHILIMTWFHSPWISHNSNEALVYGILITRF